MLGFVGVDACCAGPRTQAGSKDDWAVYRKQKAAEQRRRERTARREEEEEQVGGCRVLMLDQSQSMIVGMMRGGAVTQ